jgi:ABC-type branched-subunit amino acid transport system substrate-binding protein
MQGVQLYLASVNAAGGVHGRRLKLRTLDDTGKSALAEAHARQLVQEGVFMLFGSLEGGPSTAVAGVAQEAGVPLFGPMAGSPGLRRPHLPMVYPVRAEHREEFRALLTWARDTGLNRVAFLHADSDNGREHAGNVQRLCEELRLQFSLPLPFKSDGGEPQLAALVQRIVDDRPGLMINHGSAALYTQIIRRAKAAGSRTAFMAVNSGSSQIAGELGPLAQGMVFAQVVPSPFEGKRAITREYQAAMTRALPGRPFDYGGLEGFMTTKALVAALRAQGPALTRAGFVQGLEKLDLDLGGVSLRYRPGEHEGSRFVDLSMVSRQGQFIH